MDDQQNQNNPVPQDDPFGPQTTIPDDILEGEIVEAPEEKSDASPTTDPFTVKGEFNYLQNLQTQINLHIAKLERLKEEMQPVKEMIESYLENDAEYIELTKKAKEASTEKGRRKKELLGQQQGKVLQEQLEKFKEEQKESNEMISQLLDEYRKETGANEFEGPDGELRTIVMVAKLVRKTNLNK